MPKDNKKQQHRPVAASKVQETQLFCKNTTRKVTNKSIKARSFSKNVNGTGINYTWLSINYNIQKLRKGNYFAHL